MSVQEHSRLYIGLAFAAGIILTLGYKDVYPDLERRFRRRLQAARSPHPLNAHNVSLQDNSKAVVTSSSSSTLPSTPSQQSQQHAPSIPYEIRTGIEGTIGNTPLIRIKSLSDATGCEILAKAEFLNGAGNSPKDRVALSMIQHAEEEGLLTPNSGDVVYEGTVGSTGISLAAICRARGYRAHMYVYSFSCPPIYLSIYLSINQSINLHPNQPKKKSTFSMKRIPKLTFHPHKSSCMPSDISTEKSSLLLKLGAIVDLVPPASIVSPSQFVNRARFLASTHTSDPTKPGRGFFADQFENPANHLAHQTTTGPEIYAQCSGRLDAFVAGAGTGGTISGVALYLKPLLPNLRVVLADPQGSGLYNKIKHGVLFASTEREGTRRRHQVDSIVEGIGVNRLTANFEAGRELVDDAVKVSDDQALKMARWLVEKDGLFVGASSAVNCVAAVRVARSLGEGKRIVTILCDSGTRHLSKFWRIAGDVGGEGGSETLDDVVDFEG